MTTAWAFQKAAQAWCKASTSHKQMDSNLAEAFAEILDEVTGERDKEIALLKGDVAEETRMKEFYLACCNDLEKTVKLLKARVRMYEHALTDPSTDCAISLNGNLVYPENMTDAQVMEWAESNPE